MITVSSDRLLLRPIVEADIPAIHELLSLPETDEYNALGIPDSFEQTDGLARRWIDLMSVDPADVYTLAILRRSDDAFVGLYGLKIAPIKYRRAELWYKLHRDFWGLGYATELTRRVIHYGFQELNLHRMEAGVAVGNVGSIRVLEKSGMTREGRKRKDLPLKSGFSDSYMYSVLAEDDANATSESGK